jgi:hypothetical protein
LFSRSSLGSIYIPCENLHTYTEITLVSIQLSKEVTP